WSFSVALLKAKCATVSTLTRPCIAVICVSYLENCSCICCLIESICCCCFCCNCWMAALKSSFFTYCEQPARPTASMLAASTAIRGEGRFIACLLGACLRHDRQRCAGRSRKRVGCCRFDPTP